MAESVVSFLLGRLTTEYRCLLDIKVPVLKKASKDLEEIKNKFMSMQKLLREADAAEEGDRGLEVWVKQVRDAAYETQDVAEDFMVYSQQLHPDRTFSYKVLNLKERHLVTRIHKIKKKVKEVARRKDDYGLNRGEQGSPSRTQEGDNLSRGKQGSTSRTPDGDGFNRLEQGSTSRAREGDSPNRGEQGSTFRTAEILQQCDRREDALVHKEAQTVVGMEKYEDQLKECLVHNEQNSGVISIYGEGGLGKTTLVKQVFDNGTVKEKFSCRAWITVSHTSDIKFLLQDLIKQIVEDKKKMKEVKEMDVPKLEEMLRNHLGGKRYVIVLDNMWYLRAWQNLKKAFPGDIGHGNWIIVTTRFENIARECVSENHGHELELQPLTPEDSWKLFCKIVFASDGVNSCPTHLRKMSETLLERCEGLPLAIVCIAGLLRTKDQNKWDQVNKDLRKLMQSNENLTDLNLIFSQSYFDLPYHLKFCLLYLSIFPEDYHISCSRLLQLWVVEGFVDDQDGISSNKTKEDIAKSYLDELISRSLVQAEELSLTGRFRKCWIHKLLREFILSKAHKQDFVSHLDAEGLKDQVNTRRLSILNTKNLNKKQKLFSHLRSFFAFAEGNLEFDRELFSKMKNVALLQLGRCHNKAKCHIEINDHEFLKGLNGQKHLRYLSLQGISNITELPDSIGTLSNVRILDLGACHNLEKLSSRITLMTRLTHLDVSECYLLEYMPQGLENLSELQVLKGFVIGDSKSKKPCQLSELAKLKNLRKLSIRNASSDELELGELKHFQSLRILIIIWGREENPTMASLSDLPQELEKLELRCFPQPNAPRWLRPSALPNLKRLYIRGGKLGTLDEEENHSWKVKILRLKFLTEFGVEWLKLLDLFPDIQSIERVNCDGVRGAPSGTVWKSPMS